MNIYNKTKTYLKKNNLRACTFITKHENHSKKFINDKQ